MEVDMRFLRISYVKFVVLCGLLTVVIACQTKLFTFEGATVREGISVPLKEGGPHSGKWSYWDDEVVINYTYTKTADTLKISGEVDVIFGRNRTNHTEHFFLRLHFIDADSKIMNSKFLVNTYYFQPVEIFPFEATLQVPSGTIAFSYDGKLTSGNSSDDAGWTFWMDPRRSNAYGVFY